jgi:uncharacterized phage protein (TIGR02218 family)
MTYWERENSTRGEIRLELLRFVLGTQRWLYTTSSQSIVHQSETYVPEAIKVGETALTEDYFKNRLEIEVPREHPIAAMFIPWTPEGGIDLTIFRSFVDETEFIVYWQGKVLTAVAVDDQISRLYCDPIISTTRKVGHVPRIEKGCDHQLYGFRCGVNPESFKVEGTIGSVNGTTVTASAFATQEDGWFVAGEIVVGPARRMILTHSGSTVTITAPIPGIASGKAFTAYAGCDQTSDACKNRFNNNKINYGGHEWMPEKNPFSGDAVA